jgi:hypothetical protein
MQRLPIRFFDERKGDKMIKKNVLCLFVSLIIAALFITSCSSTTSPTLTFTSENCTYSGPKTIQKDATLTWVIEDDSHEDYAYVVMTLEKGKSIDDVTTWHSGEQPSWASILYWEQTDSGNQTKSKQFNLGANAAYKGDPLYIVCFFGEYKIGQVGPIKVK